MHVLRLLTFNLDGFRAGRHQTEDVEGQNTGMDGWMEARGGQGRGAGEGADRAIYCLSIIKLAAEICLGYGRGEGFSCSTTHQRGGGSFRA